MFSHKISYVACNFFFKKHTDCDYSKGVSRRRLLSALGTNSKSWGPQVLNNCEPITGNTVHGPLSIENRKNWLTIGKCSAVGGTT